MTRVHFYASMFFVICTKACCQGGIVTEVNRTRDSLEQPSTARRALLTGGAAAAGLAAFTAGTLASAPPADAASSYISISDWINVLNNPYGASAVNDGSAE